jgi:diacylglycerol kinase (ATP)
MPRIKAIFNPQANRGDNYKQHDFIFDLLHKQAETASLNGLLYQIDWVTTEEPGHATELAYQAALNGYDTIVAIGGDGTIHEVVNGMMRVDPDQRPKLGIIPTGTGNDLTNNFGLSTDLAEAVRCLFQENTRPLDVGMVSDGVSRSQYWVNTLGFGFSGAVTVVARSSTSILRGFVLYLYIVLKTILFYARNNDIRVQVDDGDPVERSISMVNICNGPAEGGGFPVAPHALMDDGLLSYTFMRRMSRVKMLYFLPIVLAAKHTNKVKHFEFGNAHRLHIEARDPLTVHIDGELFARLENDLRQLEVAMIPSALRTLSMS